MTVHAVALSVGSDVGVEATINDVPFAATPGRDPYSSDMPIEHDVVPGTNVVVVAIGRPGRGTTGEAPRQIKAGPDLYVSVKVHANEGSMQGDVLTATSQVLTEQRWPAEGTSDVTLPHRLEITFAAPAARRPVWFAAPILQAGAVDAEALAAVEHLAMLLRNRDFAGVAAAMKFKYEDMAQVYPIYGSADRMQAVDGQSLRELMAEPEATVVDPRTLTPMFRLRAGGRMVEALGGDGEPLLRVTHRGTPKPEYLKAMFARIGGTLMPVR